MTKKASPKNQPETLIGIDYGESNIGLALGKNDLVYPLMVISGKNVHYAAQEITRIAIQNKVDKFIVGIPLNPEGKDTYMAREARKFAKILKILSKKPVVFQEESETTKEARTLASELGSFSGKGTPTDHLAAGIILKRYFSSDN